MCVGLAAASAVAITASAQGSAAWVINVGAEGAESASVNSTKVWNVRQGHNRFRVTAISKATYEGFRSTFVNYDPTNSDAVREERVAIPPTTVDVRDTGNVRLECLRTKKDPWYSSRDSSRTVLSNTTRVHRLPMRSPKRCRITVSLDAWNYGSNFTTDPRTELTVTYSLVRFQVQSIR